MSWATAATNIQDAVDASNGGDTVLVTNGVYAVGERDVGYGRSRVTITKAIQLESVNGPLATTIDGDGSVRCVYLSTNAVGLTRFGRHLGGGALRESAHE
jgi:hypothetical protein